MVARLLIAAFLLAHASVHGAFLAPRPPVTAGGPAWPFELGQSWIPKASRPDRSPGISGLKWWMG